MKIRWYPVALVCSLLENMFLPYPLVEGAINDPIDRLVSCRWTSVFLIVGYVLWFLLTELGPMALPGDFGAILWIPLHFIVNPILALGVALAAVAHAFRHKGVWLRFGVVLSGAAILLVAYTNLTGELWLVEAMGIRFR